MRRILYPAAFAIAMLILCYFLLVVGREEGEVLEKNELVTRHAMDICARNIASTAKADVPFDESMRQTLFAMCMQQAGYLYRMSCHDLNNSACWSLK